MRANAAFALTGAEIAPSDEVFRPSSVAPVPVNINAMILASVLDAISLADEREVQFLFVWNRLLSPHTALGQRHHRMV